MTVCSVDQLSAVKVSAPDTVATSPSPLVGVTVTSAEGWLVSTTVYDPVAPSPMLSEVGETVTPAASSSVTDTSTGSGVTGE